MEESDCFGVLCDWFIIKVMACGKKLFLCLVEVSVKDKHVTGVFLNFIAYVI